MIIHSFSIAYFAVEDRLLLQAKGVSSNQNFWVTRRATGMLSHAIQSLLAEIYELSGVKKEHLPFAQSFGQDHASATHAPFADQLDNPASTPLLLFRVDYGAVDTDRGQLVLLDESGNGQEFQLNTEMLHAISNLLAQQSVIAEWSLLLTPTATVLNQPRSESALH